MSDVQDLFKKQKQAWLESARSTAKKLLRNRLSITVEDVLERCPRPSYIHRNTTGMIFHDKDFKAVGWMSSRRPAMNGRPVRVWRLAE